ncbi:MAG: hypothetical protein A3F18_02215 [Legionellales bacterium RIFCSPHIGHO2_12_FULL_37_14]|nr:MAG: hypothetical protein A3F18_02215 [Legionellales bacterium RIFCSPHIGHO2_12_FULL_37_14]
MTYPPVFIRAYNKFIKELNDKLNNATNTFKLNEICAILRNSIPNNPKNDTLTNSYHNFIRFIPNKQRINVFSRIEEEVFTKKGVIPDLEDIMKKGVQHYINNNKPATSKKPMAFWRIYTCLATGPLFLLLGLLGIFFVPMSGSLAIIGAICFGACALGGFIGLCVGGFNLAKRKIAEKRYLEAETISWNQSIEAQINAIINPKPNQLAPLAQGAGPQNQNPQPNAAAGNVNQPILAPPVPPPAAANPNQPAQFPAAVRRGV